MTTTKKALQKQVEKLKQENEQYHFCLQYALFDFIEGGIGRVEAEIRG